METKVLEAILEEACRGNDKLTEILRSLEGIFAQLNDVNASLSSIWQDLSQVGEDLGQISEDLSRAGMADGLHGTEHVNSPEQVPH